MKTKLQSGFTIIELMITLVIAGVLIGVGVPAMTEFLQNERVTSFTNKLLSDVMYARSKAVELNIPVVFCASSDGDSCNSNDYKDGWIVRSAPDGDPTQGELFRIQDAIDGDIEFKISDEELSTIAYDSSGFTPDVANGQTISVYDSRGEDLARTLSFSRTGRVGR
jgi:type IV fimbrial biogenesis protein FimT